MPRPRFVHLSGGFARAIPCEAHCVFPRCTSREEHKVVSVDGAAVTLERMVGLSTERLIQISLLRPTVSSTLHQVSDMLEDIGGAVGDDVPGGGESKQDALEDIIAPS